MIGGFCDGNLWDFHESFGGRRSKICSVQMHSSLIQRLRQEKELEGHQGCVNAISWNSNDHVWNYSGLTLLHSIETGHSGNIFCKKFIPETSDELVASGAGDAEVRIFNLSRLSRVIADGNAITPSALFQCHTRRDKKIEVEDSNPNVIWSARKDGNLRQHDLQEVVNCVQCHPFGCVVATSGIDNTIKIWIPTAPAPSMADVLDEHCICVDDAIDSNQHRLTSNREIILPFEILERFRMQELAEGNMHPFECMQT